MFAMAEVIVQAAKTIQAKPERVFAALADYTDVRKRMLTEQFSEYEVREGGTGAGTVVHWKLQATKKRVRDCLFDVTEPAERELVETDRNSSMVTTWSVVPEGDGSTVRVETKWNGAGGIGGFFEKTFAPGGMRKIYQAQLSKLAEAVSG